jgi:cytoskeletal protein CcmA (bactofilin family)
MFGKSGRKVGDIIEPQVKSSAVTSSVLPQAPETSSSISSGLTIVGKILGQGKLAIFGHVEGEIHASTVQIGDGARVEGDIVAEELTIGGRVKGTMRANRVKLNSTAIVEGDIYHRSLAIEENAQFEGMSRRQESAVDIPAARVGISKKPPRSAAGETAPHRGTSPDRAREAEVTKAPHLVAATSAVK